MCYSGKYYNLQVGLFELAIWPRSAGPGRELAVLRARFASLAALWRGHWGEDVCDWRTLPQSKGCLGSTQAQPYQKETTCILFVSGPSAQLLAAQGFTGLSPTIILPVYINEPEVSPAGVCEGGCSAGC